MQQGELLCLIGFHTENMCMCQHHFNTVADILMDKNVNLQTNCQ